MNTPINKNAPNVVKKKKPAPEPAAFQRNISKDDEPQGASLWLITFTDIMALMLTFFVLLYSMSVPQEEKWEEIISSLNEGFSKFYSPQNYSGPQDSVSIEKITKNQALNLDYLRSIIGQMIDKNEQLQNVKLIAQGDKLIMALPQDLLFEEGQTNISLNGKRALFSLGGLLSRIQNAVEVIGHADPQPITGTGGEFQSNWELSLARAVEVSNILRQVGYDRPMPVRGASSARYDETPTDLGEEERRDLSRRVDIVIMKDDGNTKRAFEFQ